MKRDKFSSERVSEKRSSNSKKTWGMKQMYFSSSPVIFLLGSPTGWLTPAHKLHSTAYNHWTERNCTQLNSLLPAIHAWPQHIAVIHCHVETHLHAILAMFFNAYKGMSHHPFGYWSLALYLIWGWVNHTVRYRCGWIPGGVARADLCCPEQTGGIL